MQSEQPDRRTTPHGETPYSPVSLLRALTSSPLDVDALRGTDGRHEQESLPDTPATRTLTTVAALALGFAVAVSVTSLREAASSEQSPRAQLQQQVRESRAEAEALESQRDQTADSIAELQEQMLDSGDSGAGERLIAYEIGSGAVAMSGPGVVLTIDDSAPLPADPGTTGGAVNRVTDGDLQIAVNGLWAAGAEAIAINGQRITATSAIRRAGDAVLVDFRPLSPPYEVTALGDSTALRSEFDQGSDGEYLAGLSSRFGIRTSWEESQELTVPARTVGALREASGVRPERGAVPEGSAPGSSEAENGTTGEGS